MSNLAKKSVQLFYDVVSPFSWIGFETLCRYRSKWAIDLQLRPMFLGGVMKDSGNEPPGMNERKRAYMGKDLERLKSLHKIPINQPANPLELMFQPGTLGAQRFLTAINIKHPKYLEDVSRQLYLRAWSRNQPIFEMEHFHEAAKEAGMNDIEIADVLRLSAEKQAKDELKSTTNEANSLGAFGAPTILVEGMDGKKHMVFGSDRMEVIAYLLGEKYHGPLPELSKL